MPAFDLKPSTAATGMFLLNVYEPDASGDPDLADDETYLLGQDELWGLFMLLAQHFNATESIRTKGAELPPIEKFEVG